MKPCERNSEKVTKKVGWQMSGSHERVFSKGPKCVTWHDSRSGRTWKDKSPYRKNRK